MSCRSIIAAAAAVVLLTAGRARGGPAGADPATDYALDFARDQFWTYSEAHTPAPPTPPSVYPSNTNRTTGVWNTAGSGGWESGFFPGGQFILYETRLSKPNPGPHDDPAQWWSWAKTWATPVVAKSDAATLLNGEHDLTYRLLCSRGHWWRLTADPVERDLQRTELLKGATNVLRTYAVKIAGGVAVPVNVKAFRTEDRVSGLDARGDFHVFADHVPDTALVLWAARQLNDVESARKCVNHFLTASRGTIRPDGSMNQRAFYNSVTGDFINGQTKQGLNNNSTWSRGQAWVLYGYTAGAQETGHPDVVATARKIADYFIAHLPKPPTGDYIPPWDFDPSIDPTLPENKDSSAGAIAASALLHLSRLIPDGDPCRQIYWDTATQILAKLAEPPVESNPAPYLAVNSNPFHQSVLVHGAYNFPGGNYDQGQIWGDYFFLEGLLRHRKLTADPPPVAVTVRASPDRIAEGGPACGVFTFTRTGDTSQDLVVFVRNLGTASAGTDFDYSTPFTGTVTIPAGATQAAIEVTPIPNDIAGENKFVTLVVDGTAGYVAELPYAATVVITDDDRPTVDLALVGGTLALTEGSTDTARLQLKRTDGNSNVNVTVTLAAQGTAVLGVDYTLSPSRWPDSSPDGTYVLTAAELPVDIDVATVGNNTHIEMQKTIYLTVPWSDTYDRAPNATIALTIADDDSGIFDGTGDGLVAAYYTYPPKTPAKLDTFVLTRIDPQVNFAWGGGSPDPAVTADYFAASWTGWVQAATTENYVFTTNTDDGVRLWVNNQLLIDEWKNQGTTPYDTTLLLVAGKKYKIRMEYYDYSGSATAQLLWSKPNMDKMPVQKSQLFSQGEIAVPLAAGYNLIAMPVNPAATLTAEDLVQQINADGGDCTSVIAYDTAQGAFVTHPAGTAVGNFVIEVGAGYFVRCTRISTWKAKGYALNTQRYAISLKAGYNLIGLPLEPVPLTKYTAEGAGIEINSQPPGGATQIIRYNASTGQFETHPIGTAVNNFTLDLGRGYFIRCAADSTWTASR